MSHLFMNKNKFAFSSKKLNEVLSLLLHPRADLKGGTLGAGAPSKKK
jgi:hypothetical protein